LNAGIADWIDDCLAIDPSARASAKQLYTSYSQWHTRTRARGRPVNRIQLGKRLTKKGFEVDDSTSKHERIGVRVLSDD
jgi:hypothetical protein